MSIYALYLFKVDWWYWLVLLIAPDLSMLGYSSGNKAGAILYNLFHHKATATFVFVIGMITSTILLQIAGVLIFGHSSMDILGYG